MVQVRPRRGDEGFFFALEGLRGLAALVVMVSHYSFWTGVDSNASRLLPHAYLAVDFFFVLSGFVIAHAYSRALLAGMGLARFALRRVVRLWPLLVLSLGLALAAVFLAGLLGMAHGRRSLYTFSFLLGLALLPTPEAVSPLTFRVFPLNGPAWSLSVEMGVNLAYAATLRHLTARRLLLLAAAAGLALLLAAAATGSLDIGVTWPSYGGGWLRASWGFLAGVLVHRLWLRRAAPRLPAPALHGLGLGFLGLSAVPGESALLDLAAAMLAFPLAVYLGTGIELAGRSRRLAALLGHLSYAVYVTHGPVMDVLRLLDGALGAGMDGRPLPAFLLSSLVAIGVAWALDRFYDKPVRAWLARRLAAHRGTAAAPAGHPARP